MKSVASGTWARIRFANDESVREIARVLKPSGALALIWNSRVHEHPLQAVIDELTGELATEVSTLYEGFAETVHPMAG